MYMYMHNIVYYTDYYNGHKSTTTHFSGMGYLIRNVATADNSQPHNHTYTHM